MSFRPQIRRSDFSRGLRWLPVGAELLLRGLGPMAGIAALWLLISLIVVIPVIGQAILALITPLLTAGVLKAYAMVSGGSRPAPTTLLAAWNHPGQRSALLLVGLWGIFGSLIAVSILAVWLGTQLTPEQLEAAMSSPEALARTLAEVSIGGGLILSALALTLVLATMYFAIPLIMFGRMPVIAALTVSLKAVFINWTAFLGFGIAAVLLILGLGLIMALVLSLLSIALGGAGQVVGQVLFLLMTMFVQMIMAGAQYVAFRDVFQMPGENRDDSESEDDQLLA